MYIKKISIALLACTSTYSLSNSWLALTSFDPFDDSRYLVAGTLKENEGAIIFACNEKNKSINGGILFAIAKKNIAQEDKMAFVRLRVDQGSLIEGSWPFYGSVLEIEDKIIISLIEQLKSGNEALVQVSRRGSQPMQVKFDLKGSSQAFDEFLKVCDTKETLLVSSHELGIYNFYHDRFNDFNSHYDAFMASERIRKEKEEEENIIQFKKNIQNFIDNNWKIPSSSVSNTRNAVKIFFNQDGSVLNVQLGYSSGDELFDKSTIAVTSALSGLGGLEKISYQDMRRHFSPALVHFHKP